MTTWKMFRPPVPHPFSMSASDDDWVLVSGVGAHRPDGSIAEDLTTQVKDSVEAVKILLENAGSSLDEIVWFKPHVSRRENAPVMDEILSDVFGDVPPAGGALVICELADPRMLVEFEVWARRGARRTLAI